MSIACYPKRWEKFCVSEDDKKKIEPVFNENL